MKIRMIKCNLYELLVPLLHYHSTGVLGTWRNQFGSCFAIQFMVVVSVLDLMALFRSWTFFGKMG